MCTDTRFETCDHCNGSGVEAFRITVYEHRCGFPHDDSDERPCPACDGAGQREYEVESITLEDCDGLAIPKREGNDEHRACGRT